ncbi:TraB/GumN family protein [Variovorax sp. GT1P44]|uniref:TraB/GumN family protein n=1 Tax=Variovorax sp. GT1P44 TaxID=3443742 RepID=UPI003F455B54
MLYEVAGTKTRILGTLHFFPPGPQRWIDPVRRIYDWADRIYVEMKSEKGLALFTLPARYMARDLPADLYAAVQPSWPEEVVGPLDDCNLPGVCLLVGALGLSRVDGIEAMVRTWLGPSGDVLELETPEDVVQAANEVPLDDLLFSLRFVLRQQADAQRSLEAKSRAWRVHDIPKLEALMKMGSTEAMRRALLETRNRKWAETIAREAKSPERTLVLCGAAHLCGPGNLREVLQKDHGYVVQRLLM